eukprot:1747541-Prymnesium_polylepis.1
MMRRVVVADATRALRCPGWHETVGWWGPWGVCGVVSVSVSVWCGGVVSEVVGGGGVVGAW